MSTFKRSSSRDAAVKMPRYAGVAMLLVFAAACRSQPDFEKVAIGQDVAFTRADGGVIEGKVVSVDDTRVHVTTGRATKAVLKDQIVDVQVGAEGKPAMLPPVARFREYTLPEGTTFSLRLATAINSGTARVEDRVEATLAEAVSVGGTDVLRAGSSLAGTVAAVEGSGKVKGLASITLHFTSMAAAGRDDRYDIDATYSETARATKGSDAAKIGVGAGVGAAIGGLVGGKRGAVKGAVIGGGAGTGVVLATKGDEVERAAGARLTVRLKRSLDVRVPTGHVVPHG